MASSPLMRRTRGVLLRLAQARMSAAAVGTACVSFSVSLLVLEFFWESWLSDGLGLVLGGTGAALIMVAISGRTPDWIDPDNP